MKIEKEPSARQIQNQNLHDEIDRLREKCREYELELDAANKRLLQCQELPAAGEVWQNKYVQHLLKALPEIIVVLNSELEVVLCSRSYLRVLGVDDMSEIIGKCPYKDDTTYYDYGSGRKLKARLRELMRENKAKTQDMDLSFRGDSVTRTYRLEHIPIYSDAGTCDGIIISFTDINDLAKAIKRAESADDAKSDFLATMSHEIRTPMNAVKGLSELLSLTRLDATQRNYVGNIINASNSLLDIINDILDFSKISAKRIEFVEGAYKLDELVIGVCNVINVKAEDKGLLLTVDADPDLPGVLWGDDFRVRQILTNILTNAVKYTHKGFVRLTVDIEREASGGVLVCSVTDSGIGIHEQDIPSLFDAFSRVDLQANRDVSGTGLGLSITKQLAEAMGGAVDVSSVYGEGTTFTVRLPQRIVDEAPIACVPESESKSVMLLDAGQTGEHILSMLARLNIRAAAESSADAIGDSMVYSHCIFGSTVSRDTVLALRKRMPDCRFGILESMRHAASMSNTYETMLYTPLLISDLATFLNTSGRQGEQERDIEPVTSGLMVRNASILVVDDNEINRIVSSDMLESFRAEVVCVEDGYKAIEICDRQRFDLIFMDHMMPGMDGVETTKEIRAGNGLNRDTPILALTANVVNDMESQYLSSGMNDCIAKPIELLDLEKALAKWLPPGKLIAGTAAKRLIESGEKDVMTPDELVSAMDRFGLYASDVMREINGDFDTFIKRMQDASEVLGTLIDSLKVEVADKRWESFAIDAARLRELLYGIGARDCSERARKLTVAAQRENINYIYEDFYSLMGNMFMLYQKLKVFIPVAKGGNLQDLPLDVPEYLLACLEKLGNALERGDQEEALLQIAHTAAFSLDMDIDMALKAVKADLETGNFESAHARHKEFFEQYESRIRAES